MQQKNTSPDLRTRLQESVAVAERIFDELDSDHSGMLDIQELALLAKRLGQRWAKKDLELYFARIVQLEMLFGRNKQADTTVGDTSANVAATCLHVGNLPAELESEAALRLVFERFGVVIAVTVRYRREQKQGLDLVSWALVSFRSPSEAQTAIAAWTSQVVVKDKKQPALPKMSPELAGLVVRLVDTERQHVGAYAMVMQKHIPARMRGTMALRVTKSGGKNPEKQTEISREIFVQWWVSHMRGLRRKLLMGSMKLFDDVDKETNGALDKKALITLVKRAGAMAEYKSGTKTTLSLGNNQAPASPTLNFETVFESIDKRENDRVSRSEWEEWFSEHIGYDGANLPLLPEHMARKIEAAAVHQSHSTNQIVKTQVGERQKKTGKALWTFLRTRLRVLVSFQGVWGTSHDIYPNMDSAAEDEGPLPAGIIDPDATFAVWWNLAQLVALVYVAVFVPIRVAWGNEPAPFSSVWFVASGRGRRCYSIPCSTSGTTVNDSL